jgi:hypothetical protein
MAVLTKVRVPVSDIATISNGTTAANIATAGANITETVSGNLVGTWQTTGLLIDAARTLTAKTITNEVLNQTVAAGATGSLSAQATKMQLKTTSAHVLELLANSVLGLTVGTDGKLTLGVQGTSGSHLVNKTYVDAAIAASGSAPTATAATTGGLSIPTAAGTIIFKWGRTNGLGQLTQVTFGSAFPNAIFIALANEIQNRNANSDGARGVYDLQTTGFKINQSNGSAYTNPWAWLAIGY